MLDPGYVRHVRLSEALPVQAALLLLGHDLFSSRFIQVPGVKGYQQSFRTPPNRLYSQQKNTNLAILLNVTFCWGWCFVTLYIYFLCKVGLQLGVSKGHGLFESPGNIGGFSLPWWENPMPHGVFRRIVGVAATVWLGCTASLRPATIIHAERVVEPNLFGRRCNMFFRCKPLLGWFLRLAKCLVIGVSV